MPEPPVVVLSVLLSVDEPMFWVVFTFGSIVTGRVGVVAWEEVVEADSVVDTVDSVVSTGLSVLDDCDEVSVAVSPGVV